MDQPDEMKLPDDQKWRVSQAFTKLLDPTTLQAVAEILNTVPDEQERKMQVLAHVGLPIEDYDAFYGYLRGASTDQVELRFWSGLSQDFLPPAPDIDGVKPPA